MERRVLAAFLYYAGLSYRKIVSSVDRSYEGIRQWFHRLNGLFEPKCRDRQEVAVEETKSKLTARTLYLDSSRLRYARGAHCGCLAWSVKS